MLIIGAMVAAVDLEVTTQATMQDHHLGFNKKERYEKKY